MLSPFIHLLQQRSFRRSGTETCAGRSATPRKMSSPAAHLFDARRTLPPHSCQVPQCWAVGRTNGMKRSLFGAVAAARGRTEHSAWDFSGFGEAQCLGLGQDYHLANQILFVPRAVLCTRSGARSLEFRIEYASCSSCSGWPSQSCWQASRLPLERRPHPCSRCRARPAAAVAVCVSALISGVAAVSTCKARHKALSRLADAGVKRMAAHDGRDVHVSAQPAVLTPIDSDA